MAQVMQWSPAIRNYVYEEGEVEISTCPSHPISCMYCLAKKKAQVKEKDYIYRIIVLYMCMHFISYIIFYFQTCCCQYWQNMLET